MATKQDYINAIQLILPKLERLRNGATIHEASHYHGMLSSYLAQMNRGKEVNLDNVHTALNDAYMYLIEQAVMLIRRTRKGDNT